MFICEVWLFDWYFPQSCNLICRSTDISNCFRESLCLRDNESQLYQQTVYICHKDSVKYSFMEMLFHFDDTCLLTITFFSLMVS